MSNFSEAPSVKEIIRKNIDHLDELISNFNIRLKGEHSIVFSLPENLSKEDAWDDFIKKSGLLSHSNMFAACTFTDDYLREVPRLFKEGEIHINLGGVREKTLGELLLDGSRNDNIVTEVLEDVALYLRLKAN